MLEKEKGITPKSANVMWDRLRSRIEPLAEACWKLVDEEFRNHPPDIDDEMFIFTSVMAGALASAYKDFGEKVNITCSPEIAKKAVIYNFTAMFDGFVEGGSGPYVPEENCDA